MNVTTTAELGGTARDALEALSIHGSLTSLDLCDILNYKGWGTSRWKASDIAQSLTRVGLAEVAVTDPPSYTITVAGRALLAGAEEQDHA